jgi:lipopolysaccharide/colanic/teichoic acid biosynthesis glycosyltransferase
MSASPQKIFPMPEGKSSPLRRRSSAQIPSTSADRYFSLLEQDTFESILTLERKRAERSGNPFALMLLDASLCDQSAEREKLLKTVLMVLASATRETDLIGWSQEGAVLGVIFTEIDTNETHSVLKTLLTRVQSALEKQINPFQLRQIVISLHLFPEQLDKDSSGHIADTKFYPELSRQSTRQRTSLAVKRAIDILASGFLLILFSPLFALIALAIKLNSKGNVFFRQERMGRLGVPFDCLKFRTMYVNNSPKVHQEFVQDFIKGKDENAEQARSAGAAVYKITNDPRVTPIGRLLRKTSLDELPQFWNVLVGEMSLVGPRPPVRYEFEIYDVWHRRRVFEAKPGITGLWQVSGRSQLRFDEMVRLDLRYSRSWSLWLDLVILLRTPGAVFSGHGAY